MTTLPTCIKVGPYRVRVSRDPGALARTRVLKGDRRIGEFSNVDLTILLDDELAPDVLAETLLHETLHAVFEVVGGCRGKHDSEAWIQFAAPMLLAVLRENPALVAFLLAQEETDAEGTIDGARGDHEQALRADEAADDCPRGVRVGQQDRGQGDHERGEGQGQEVAERGEP